MSINPVTAVISAGKSLLDKIVADKDLKIQTKHEKEMAVFENALKQLEINKEEAKHPSIFVSGWRPFIGWTCGISLCYNFILYPTMAIFIDNLPQLDTSQLTTVLFAMLGLGAYRTYEKTKDIARNNLR